MQHDSEGRTARSSNIDADGSPDTTPRPRRCRSKKDFQENTHTQRQTDRQRDRVRHTHRQTDRQTDGQRECIFSRKTTLPSMGVFVFWGKYAAARKTAFPLERRKNRHREAREVEGGGGGHIK